MSDLMNMDETTRINSPQVEAEALKFYSKKSVDELVKLYEICSAQQKDWVMEALRAKPRERIDYFVEVAKQSLELAKKGDYRRADELRERMEFVSNIPIELQLGTVDRE